MQVRNDPAFPGLVSFMGVEGFFLNGRFCPIFKGGAPEGDGTSSEGGSESGNSGEDDDSQNSSGDEEDEDKGKTFTQEEVNAILAKEKSKLSRGKIDPKALGFQSQKELQAFVDAMKKKEDEDKTDADKQLQEAIDNATKNAEEKVLSKANQRFIKSEFKVAARDAGVPAEALEDAFVLAQTLEDWQNVEVDDEADAVTGLDKEFFKELKKQKPFLFGTKKEGSGDDAGAGAGGGGRNKGGDGNVTELYPGLKNVQ